MSRSRLLFFALSVALVLPIVSVSLWAAAARDADDSGDSLYKYLSVFTEIVGLVRQAYVDEPDLDALMTGALDGTTDAMDPFSVYIPASVANGYRVRTRIDGGSSGLLVLKEGGIAYVVSIEEGSVADEADIERGDIVAAIGGEETRLMPLWRIWKQLDGAPGSQLDLRLIRLGEPKTAALTLRAAGALPARIETTEGVDVLRLARIAAETAFEVRRLLAGRDADRLVIDLRGAAFGEIPAAYEVAKVFATGELGALVAREGSATRYTAASPAAWQGRRLVVLVDHGTLGPGEVLATILRDRAGAALVGEETFGYAGRQQLVPLSSGAHLQITDAFYTGPDGTPIHEGLEPDVVVDELSRTFSDQERSLRDLILQRGLDVVRGEEPLPQRKLAA